MVDPNSQAIVGLLAVVRRWELMADRARLSASSALSFAWRSFASRSKSDFSAFSLASRSFLSSSLVSKVCWRKTAISL